MQALILAAALAASPQPQEAPCKTQGPAQAQLPPAPVPGIEKKLGELPPGFLYRTVLRTVGGCSLVEVQVNGQWTLKPDGAAAVQPVPAGRRK